MKNLIQMLSSRSITRLIRLAGAATLVLMGTAFLARAQTCVPPSDMTGWWKFEETSGTTAADEVGVNDGTYVGSPVATTGIVGNGLNFDGVDDAVSLISRPVAIQGDGARSIFAWVRTTNNGWQAVVATGSPTDGEAFNLVVGYGGTPGIVGVMGYNNDFYPASGRRVDDGAWHLIGATYDGAGTLTTYVDGNLDNIGNMTFATSGQNNYIGQSNHSGYEFPFQGDIDEAMIFDRALTSCEVAAIYTMPCAQAAPPRDMGGWWKFEETSGTTAADEVGVNDGTYIGSPVVTTGIVGNGLNFDGVDDAVSLVSRPVAIQGDGARSILAWVRTTNNSWQAVMATGTADYSQAFNLVVGYGGTPGIVGVMGYYNDFYPGSGRRVDDGAWHLIGATYDGAGTLTTYVDGNLDNIGNMTFATSGQNNYIGQSNHSGYEFPFQGDIDEAMIFDRALTRCEVAAMFASPITTPPCAANVRSPINADGTSIFNANRGVVPVKFRLECNGSPTCDLPPATIAVARTAGGVIGAVNESVYSSQADSGPNFRVQECQYHYNLNANALGVGTYRVDILINGQVVGSATFQLR